MPQDHEIISMGKDDQMGTFLLITGPQMPEVPMEQEPPMVLLDTRFLEPNASLERFFATQEPQVAPIAFDTFPFEHGLAPP